MYTCLLVLYISKNISSVLWWNSPISTLCVYHISATGQTHFQHDAHLRLQRQQETLVVRLQ